MSSHAEKLDALLDVSKERVLALRRIGGALLGAANRQLTTIDTPVIDRLDLTTHRVIEWATGVSLMPEFKISRGQIAIDGLQDNKIRTTRERVAKTSFEVVSML